MWGLDLKSCSFLALAGPHLEPVLGAASSHLGQGIGSCPVPGAELRPSFEDYREEDCFCLLNPSLSTSLTPTAPPCVPPLTPKTTPAGLWGTLGSLFCQGTTRWRWMLARQLPKFLSESEELGC